MSDASGSASALGIAALLTSLACLGTWPALLRLCTWKTQEEPDYTAIHTTTRRTTYGHVPQQQSSYRNFFSPQNRHVCHVYLDYALSYVLSSSLPLVLSLILSSSSSSNQQQHNDHSHILLIIISMIGGALLSLGNLCMQWSVSIFGAPLTTVLAIQASMTVVLGTSLNYLLERQRTAKPHLLAAGVAAFLVAIVLATCAQLVVPVASSGRQEYHGGHPTRLQQQQQRRRQRQDYTECGDDMDPSEATSNQRKGAAMTGGIIALHNIQSHDNDNDDMKQEQQQQQQSSATPSTRIAPVDSSDTANGDLLYRSDYAQDKNDQSSTTWNSMAKCDSFYSDDGTLTNSAATAAASRTRTGLYVAFAGGLCFGFFSPAFNIAVNDPFAWSSSSSYSSESHEQNTTASGGSGLSVAVANIWFSIAFCLSSILGNVYLMTNMRSSPHQYNMGIGISPLTALQLYLKEPLSERRLALLAGAICALGNLLQFQGGKLAGFATADLVQAFPLVATVWDVLLFGEFKHATVYVLLIVVGMYIAYLCGIVLLAFSIDY